MFYIDKIRSESTTISSFYLKPGNGKNLEKFLPGQFINVKIALEDGNSISRSYTLSDSPNDDYYRLTIKREKQGKVSRYFHDHLIEGSEIEVSSPMGNFHLDINSQKPIVLISGGVGITPMMSMLEYIVAHQPHRKVEFLHSSYNKDVQPFFNRLKQLDAQYGNLSLSIFHSAPLETEETGKDYDIKGFITQDALAKTLGEEKSYFLCGPTGFMEAMYDHLRKLNIPETRIFYEFFGDAKPLGTRSSYSSSSNTGISVKFSRSDLKVGWVHEIGSLLDLAEANGLRPDSSCRMGTCSSCESKLISGSIEYDPEPFIEAAEGNIFICCAKPTSDITIEI
ncbi:2Fe-2S iron-sulfur cluster binding domain-containing protein [Leptobacterium flavescens]|uniref:nitric oxide dioxygenase n=1 Tax=Leptobacterium flavescens TaxID=472055 RepID=A0A6P0USA3_9FLAO|nr:FAD-binding oxidoreductase [Leptobacterium flavescens]NER14868.1 2Fe-2S iron-sulfur cluster binding domain-containing protein [Leptobacterium flavescens]